MKNNEKIIKATEYSKSCKNFQRLYYLTSNGFRPTFRGTCSMYVRNKEFNDCEDACKCFRKDPLSEEKRCAIIQAKSTIENFEQTLFRLLVYIDELDKQIKIESIDKDKED